MIKHSDTIDPRTLRVGELVELLKQYDPDVRVYGDKKHDVRIIDVDYEASSPKVFLYLTYPNYSSVILECEDDSEEF